MISYFSRDSQANLIIWRVFSSSMCLIESFIPTMRQLKEYKKHLKAGAKSNNSNSISYDNFLTVVYCFDS